MLFDPVGESPAADGDITLVDGAGPVSRAELHARVDARAEELAASGGGPHVFPVEPDVPGVVDILGAWRAGRVAVPLNGRLDPTAIEAARTTITSAPIPSDACVVLWTSGTSGRARGVALSAANLRALSGAARTRLGLGASDVWYASLSPAHVGGLALIVRAILLGGCLHAPGRFRLEHLVGTLASGTPGPTRLSLVPTQLHHLLDAWAGRAAPPRLRSVLIGGARAPVGLVDRAVAGGWPIALTYGATEMSSQVATATPDEVARGARDVGRPLDGVEVRVATDGEVHARGPTRALCYVGEAVGVLADPDGWYRTGDLGALDGDGRLRISGRRIDRIVTGGTTLDAVAIEEKVRAHAGVRDVCVVGVEDPVWGERVAAWVEPALGGGDVPAPDGLDAWARASMGSAERPRVWLVAPSLPRNPNGKVDRRRVRERLSRLD